MKKGIINYWINWGLIISFLLVFFTGIIKWPGLNRFVNIRAPQLYQISIVHDLSGLIMGLLAFAHIILNIRFMITLTKKFLKRK